MPSDSGVTSKRSTSLTSPTKAYGQPLLKPTQNARTSQNAALNGRTNGDSLIRIDPLARLAAKQFPHGGDYLESRGRQRSALHCSRREKVETLGIRVIPPTRMTSWTSLNLISASFTHRRHGSLVRSISLAVSFSN
jgi:hypothetical protein